MEITGKFLRSKPTEQITEKFKKRTFVVEFAENPTYPQILEFQLTQNNVDQIEGRNNGDIIKVLFNLKGREYVKDDKTTVFNTLEAYRVDIVKNNNSAQMSAAPKTSAPVEVAGSDDDDLPF